MLCAQTTPKSLNPCCNGCASRLKQNLTMNNTNIIYFHGFNSDKNSSTITKLRSRFPHLKSISYDYVNADKGYDLIHALIVKAIHENPEIILAGTSLGGFWANYFLQKFNVKAVLINPSINPSVSLLKYVGQIKNFNSGEEKQFTPDDAARYKKYEMEIIKGFFRVVVLGTNDETINYKKSEEVFKGKGQIILTDEGHRIQDYERIADIIKKAANTIVL